MKTTESFPMNRGMTNKVYPSFGQNAAVQPIRAIAGETLTLDARDYVDSERLPVVWKLDGAEFHGPKLVWVPNRPGKFRIVLTYGKKAEQFLTVIVGLRPRLLIKHRQKLDYFFCLISSRSSRLFAFPILQLKGGNPPAATRVIEESRKHHVAFSTLANAHAENYRRHFAMLPEIRREAIPSGLYTVFPGTLAYIGTNGGINRAAAALERLALSPPGTPVPTLEIEDLITEIDLVRAEFSDQDMFPAPEESTFSKHLGDVLNILTSASANFARSLGTDLSGDGGLRTLLTLDGVRGTISNRMFGSLGNLTRYIESALGGLTSDGILKDFSRGGDSVLPIRLQTRPAAGKGGTDSSSSSSSGWQRLTFETGVGTKWVPFDGDPHVAGKPGEQYSYVTSDGQRHYYNLPPKPDANGTQPDAGTTTNDGGTNATDAGTNATDAGTNTDDGGTKTDASTAGFGPIEDAGIDTLLKLGGTKNKTDAGTKMPVNNGDSIFVMPSAEELRWVIITRGGGLTTDPNPEGDSSSTFTRDPVIPGGGLRDPVRPDFFYEWTPTLNENRLNPNDPRVTDPGVDEGGSSSSEWSGFPKQGSQGGGLVSGMEPLSKTTTFVGNLMVESFTGFDAKGRNGNGIFGAVRVDPF